jgi:predicted transcriptional regulator
VNLRVTVSVDPDDYRRMEALARNSELSTAWLIRLAMKEFLDHYSDNGKIAPKLKAVVDE